VETSGEAAQATPQNRRIKSLFWKLSRFGVSKRRHCREGVPEMSKRRWIVLLVIAVIACGGIGMGARYYLSKCHGIDACAAADAESHERDKPSEPQ
jgi:hypothetical protein